MNSIVSDEFKLVGNDEIIHLNRSNIIKYTNKQILQENLEMIHKNYQLIKLIPDLDDEDAMLYLVEVLKNCNNLILLFDKESIPEEFFDYFLSKLLQKSKDVLSLLIPIFSSLLKLIPELSDILIQDDFVSSLGTLILENFNTNDYPAAVLFFQILMSTEGSIKKSISYLNQINNFIINIDENKIINLYLYYLDLLIKYCPDLLKLHQNEIENVLESFIPKFNDDLIYENNLNVYVSLLENNLNFMNTSVLMNLNLIISNWTLIISSNQLSNISHLKLLVLLAQNKIEFDKKMIDIICQNVSNNWVSKMYNIQVFSWKLTYFLLKNYYDMINTSVINNIFTSALDVYYSDIKFNVKEYIAFSLFNISIKSPHIFQIHYQEVYEIYKDFENVTSKIDQNLLITIGSMLNEINMIYRDFKI